ncbi:MAG: hypothetical protein FWC34_04840 [Bacteroidetes bacterium]|nr:hypothetical protein [Bacteroidota bacterium]
MKKNTLKKSLNLTSFEPFTSSGKELKGGFSLTYSGGGSAAPDKNAKNCTCSFSGNCVAGCSCQSDTPNN